MDIDSAHLDRTATAPASPAEPRVPTVINASAARQADSAATPNASAVGAAVQAVQAAIDNGPNPAFSLDYLSGLSVVTVRSTQTGQVVFQLPDTRALELARLLKEGNSISSLGLFDTTA